jgi:hypothetical protein
LSNPASESFKKVLFVSIPCCFVAFVQIFLFAGRSAFQIRDAPDTDLAGYPDGFFKNLHAQKVSFFNFNRSTGI